MPAIVVAGEEELLVQERIEELKEELLDPAWASFNFRCVVGYELKDVIDATQEAPFGPGNKVILFDRCELFQKRRSKPDSQASDSSSRSSLKGEKLLADLEDGLGRINCNTYLIFACQANFDQTLKISKIFERLAKVEKIEPIKYSTWSQNTRLMSWCRARARKVNAVIEDDAIIYLAESSEGNLRQMAQEIGKAAVFALPGTIIDLRVVEQLSPHYSSIFALLDHWVQGNRTKLLDSLAELQSRQPSAIPALALLQITLSKWIQLKAKAEKLTASLPSGRGIQRRSLPPAELAKRLQGEFKWNAWVLKSELERVERLELAWLIGKKMELTRMENLVKTGSLGDQEAFSLFLLA